MNHNLFDENSLYFIIFSFVKKIGNKDWLKLKNIEKKIEKNYFSLLKKISNNYIELFENDKEYNQILNSNNVINENEKEYLIKEKNENFLKIEDLSEKIRDILLNNHNQNVFVEIRPGTGGIEASIFAKDLFDMYFLFSKKMNWNLKMIESAIDKNGNLSLFSFLIEGKKAFLLMKNEAGVHRVQRIPKTESKGRLHTSTATVVILPEFEKTETDIPMQQLKIDTCRSSGAGGQHVNTTDSAVRITHIPTGIVAYSQDGRSQHSNKAMAMNMVKSRVWEYNQKKMKKEEDGIRSSMIGDSERSEKIRTYNWQQNRITDHRIKMRWEIKRIINGDLFDLSYALLEQEFKNKIINLENN